MVNFLESEFARDLVKHGEFYDWVAGENVPMGVFYQGYTKVERGQNFSSGHPQSPDGKYRVGGSWLMTKHTVSFHGSSQTTWRNNVGRAYVGTYKLTRSDDTTYSPVSWQNSIEAHWSEVNSYGAQAYAALKPDQPDFSPVVSLLELRRAPLDLMNRFKRLRRRVRRHPKYNVMNQAGRYYLYIQFGWIPLSRDILSFTRAFVNRKKKFDQMLRDEGRGVRRRRNLQLIGSDKDHRVTNYTFQYNAPWNPFLSPTHVTQCYGGQNARIENSFWEYTSVWCAGKSKYLLPPGPRTKGWKKNLQRRILGGQFTPSDAYNLIPWSWFMDYFTSLGSFFDAVRGGIADRVFFDYAYVMHTKEAGLSQIATQGICVSKAGGTGVATAYRDFTRVRKTRLKATPFGFGLSHEDLSPRQAGILAALSLTMT